MNEVNVDKKPINAISCFLCGSKKIKVSRYLSFNSPSLQRNIAYLIPDAFAKVLSKYSPNFKRMYNPVLINRSFFGGKAVYCLNCNTGSYLPFFSEQSLMEYYEKFYWDHRDEIEGRHIAGADVPNDIQIAITNERLNWIGVHLKEFDSAIDFGSGDCAAAYVISHLENQPKVCVVDPSKNAEQLSNKYGLKYFKSIHDAPKVDFIYSAHSIEHVHDLKASLTNMLDKLVVGGHIFIETPNIADVKLFKTLPHTPHTFMLSLGSFRFMETVFPIKIISISACGPVWRNGRRVKISEHHADLRVLIRKMEPLIV